MREIVVASFETLRQALEKISSCEACNNQATIEFRLVINYTRHVMPKEALFCQTEPVGCPNCGQDVWETTKVSLR
jgi:hypothetical protein